MLSKLSEGQEAIIVEVLAGHARERLMQMGCVPGVKVKILKVFPFEGPMAIEIIGYTLALRRAEAALVVTQPEKTFQS